MLIFMSLKATKPATPKVTTKEKLLQAALSVIRTKGYSATTVDDLCTAAGVTKGSFFHYFESKEALAVAAARHWSEITGEFFRHAPYHAAIDPLDRVLGYIEFRKQILQGTTPEFTCLVGTMVQEAYDSHPVIRAACAESIFGHAETLEKDIQAALTRHPPRLPCTARSLALHTQAVLQGAFILAKAGDDAALAAQSIDHLLAYVRLLFDRLPASPDIGFTG